MRLLEFPNDFEHGRWTFGNGRAITLGHEAIGTPDDGKASWGTKPTVFATMNEFSAEATLFEGIFFAQGVKRTECIVSFERRA